MKQISNPKQMQTYIKEQKAQGKSVGFVPTMGALHEGHFCLVQKSLNENDITVVSIFLNPTQFNNHQDLEHYPSSLEADLQQLSTIQCTAVFLPTNESMYPDRFNYKVTESQLSPLLCGKDRPGHFTGVLTVVLKLLNCVQPDRAYFGEKDYQQLRLIEEMVNAFFIPTQIIACPTVRADDGLALSSRNARLSHSSRALASQLYHSLCLADRDATIQELKKNHFAIDYVEEHMGRRFAAVRLPGETGDVRLIDNVPLPQHGGSSHG